MNNYIDKFDTSCWENASKLSCEHMKKLAINEFNLNNNFFNTNTCHPSWNRFVEDTDRELEYNMLTGFSITKKSCVNKRPEYNSGCWDKQFGVYNPSTGLIGCSINQKFDENSKAKMNDIKQCIEPIKLNDDKGALTTLFNENFYTIEQNKNKTDGIIDRYNNHNPVIGDEFSQPPSLYYNNPKLINDPTYKPIKNFIQQPIREPGLQSDCSTLYNYDRYNNQNMKLYFEPCKL